MSLTNKVVQFDADSGLVNAWVHGGPTTSITTDSGLVRSPAKLIADLNASINVDAAIILKGGVSVAGGSVNNYMTLRNINGVWVEMSMTNQEFIDLLTQ